MPRMARQSQSVGGAGAPYGETGYVSRVRRLGTAQQNKLPSSDLKRTLPSLLHPVPYRNRTTALCLLHKIADQVCCVLNDGGNGLFDINVGYVSLTIGCF